MSVTYNEHTIDSELGDDIVDTSIVATRHTEITQLLLPSRIVTHHPKAGLNPLVDLTGYLFSLLGKLKPLKSYRNRSKLQKELIHEINVFYDAIKTHGYNAEYMIVCRYVLCAAFDDILMDTAWGGQGKWKNYSLLAAFNQDVDHHEKFFAILERALKEPAYYIDLMELMYICLSMGYRGSYRATEHNQFQLEQITNTLYKHIRAFRGGFSKTLSPTPLRFSRMMIKRTIELRYSLLIILGITTCVVLMIFIGLGYLMDTISNEAYRNITHIQNSAS
jgi:type VI secretion system protein ImpK